MTLTKATGPVQVPDNTDPVPTWTQEIMIQGGNREMGGA